MSDFTVRVWNKGEQIDVREHGPITEIMPIELHVKEDGDLDDKPSLCFVLVSGSGRKYIAQISEAMLTKGLAKARRAHRVLASVTPIRDYRP